MPRAVLDTNVLVSALISPSGPSAALLLELRAGSFELVASPLLLEELADVLDRPKLRAYVSPQEAAAFVELVRTEATVLDDPTPSGLVLTSDPDDEFLVRLARAASADVLVSGDAHVLALRGALPVMSPSEFLTHLARCA